MTQCPRACLLVIAIVASALSASCAQVAPQVCVGIEMECAFKAAQKHAVKKRAFWQQALELPLAQRIGPAPPALIDYLMLDNIAHSFPNRPRAPKLTPESIDEAKAAFDELPLSVKHLLNTKLAGIYFIDDLGGTGYTDMVQDVNGNPVAGFVVLDSSVLMKQTANDWATWKENTPFKPGREFRLAAEIETASQNTRKNAIQYILLHELAHIISIGGTIHPMWNIAPKDVPSFLPYTFFQLSWARSKDGSNYESLFDADFPQRKNAVYYFGARLPAGQMLRVYENLERTNFVTLYGATGPGDDFAEAFVTYVHTVLMKRPFAVRIFQGETEVKVFEACWSQPRCVDKRKLIEKLLEVGEPMTR